MQALESLRLGDAGAAGERESARYLRELARMPLGAIEQLPASHGATVASLQQQRTELCLRHTSTFVDVCGALWGFPRAADAIEASLETLSGRCLPAALDSASAFERDARATLAFRTALVELEQVHGTAVRRLLELPALMHTCVEGLQYEDALQLAQTFFRAAQKPWARGRAMIDDLRGEMHVALAQMHEQLVRSLGDTRLELPDARRRIDHLKEISALAREHYEKSALNVGVPALAYAYLHARYAQVRAALTSAPHAPGARQVHIAGAIDAWKEAVLSAAKTVLSVFVDRGTCAEAAQLLNMFVARASELLSAYLKAELALFGTVRDGVPSPAVVEDAARALAHTHTQLQYLCASLAGVGYAAQPRTLLMAPESAAHLCAVENAALELWQRNLHDAAQRALGASEARVDATPRERSVHRAPHVLGAYPVCVELSTGLVTALNALRQFAPLRSRDAALAALADELAGVYSAIRGADVRAVYTRELVPWAETALLTGVYSEKEHVAGALARLRPELDR